MELPTKTVTVIATGHEVRINASDFDPELHAEPGAPEAKGEAAPQSTEPEKPAAKSKATKKAKGEAAPQ
jgi:hypothetical protein